MQIECYAKVDSTEFISNVDKYNLQELCQEVYDEMSEKDKQNFLHDNLSDIDTGDIIDQYQERVIGD